MDFRKVQFLLSRPCHGPTAGTDLSGHAFAGRSNVGKTSLINRLVERTNLFKTSSGGKDQSLNYF
jgi:GTP-binding protein